MSVSAEDLLSLAKKIISSSSEELDLRNAAGRAYYAVFHFCKPLAEKISPVNLDCIGGGSHEAIVTALTEHPIKSGSKEHDMRIRTLGNIMKNCKDARVKADYYIHGDFTRRQIEDLVERAERIKGLIQEIKFQ